MKKFVTELRAIDPKDGVLKTWCGQHIQVISIKDAQNYCEQHGIGYLKVIGELISEIPTKKDGITPDWNKEINYENLN